MLEDFFTAQNEIGFFIKIFGIVITVFYIFFAIVVEKQVRTLNKAVKINMRMIFTVLADVQLFLALALFAYSILLL